MPDESATPAKATKEFFKEGTPQALLATTIAGLGKMYLDPHKSDVLALLAPGISLLSFWLLQLVEKGIGLGLKHLTEKPEEVQYGPETPLDVRLKSYIRENIRETRRCWPFGSEARQLRIARAQLRRRLHAFQMGELDVSVHPIVVIPGHTEYTSSRTESMPDSKPPQITDGVVPPATQTE